MKVATAFFSQYPASLRLFIFIVAAFSPLLLRLFLFQVQAMNNNVINNGFVMLPKQQGSAVRHIKKIAGKSVRKFFISDAHSLRRNMGSSQFSQSIAFSDFAVINFANATDLLLLKHYPITALYVLDACPFCKKVLNSFPFLNDPKNDWKIKLKNIRNSDGSVSPCGLELMKKTGGKRQVPALEINGKFILFESSDIIQAMYKFFEERTLSNAIVSPTEDA